MHQARQWVLHSRNGSKLRLIENNRNAYSCNAIKPTSRVLVQRTPNSISDSARTYPRPLLTKTLVHNIYAEQINGNSSRFNSQLPRYGMSNLSSGIIERADRTYCFIGLLCVLNYYRCASIHTRAIVVAPGWMTFIYTDKKITPQSIGWP